MKKRIIALIVALTVWTTVFIPTTVEAATVRHIHQIPAKCPILKKHNWALHPYVEASCHSIYPRASWVFRVEATCWGGAKVYGPWVRPGGYSAARCFLVDVTHYRVMARS